MMIKKCGLVLLLLAFGVNAGVLKESQRFLVEINNYRGFWFYTKGRPMSYELEQAFLKTYETQKDFTFCRELEVKNQLFNAFAKRIDFTKQHSLLLFVEAKKSKREKVVRNLAKKYHLSLIVLNTKNNKYPDVFNRLSASTQDVFIVNPYKHEIRLISRAHQDCWVEEELFLDILQQVEQKRKEK